MHWLVAVLCVIGLSGTHARVIDYDDRPPPIPPSLSREVGRTMTINGAVELAKTSVDRLYNQTIPALITRFDTKNICHRRRTEQYVALVAIGASQRLTIFNGLTMDQAVRGLRHVRTEGTDLQTLCFGTDPVVECVAGEFRSLNGLCNNVNSPTWGAARQPSSRMLDPEYGDYISEPRRATSGGSLPSPLQVAGTVFNSKVQKREDATQMLVAWGLFVDADMRELSDLFGNLYTIDCCQPNVFYPECFPMRVNTAEGSTSAESDICTSYTRASVAPTERCQLGPRQQANQATSYLDGSSVYGSTNDEELQTQLRTFKNGQLRSSSVPQGKDILPRTSSNDRCQLCGVNDGQCFQTGHIGVNRHPNDVAMATLWLRQHNRIAKGLQDWNPHWDDERVYQETRRIIGAQIQHITYNEYLPLAIGVENMFTYGLQLRSTGFNDDYGMGVDATVLDEFAFGADPFLFSYGTETLNLYARANGSEPNSLPFNLVDQSLMAEPGNIDAYVRSLLRDGLYSSGLRMPQVLLARPISVVAKYVQLGRDHGVAAYVHWRKLCGLSVPQTWDDLKPIVTDANDINVMRGVYRTINDVDLMIGGLAERNIKGGLVGPTFACIIGNQFRRTRRGDRFWYENSFATSGFTAPQLAEIRKTKLARVICDNTDDIGPIQPNVMNTPNVFANCPLVCTNSELGEELDLGHWRDVEQKLTMMINDETLRKASELANERARQEQARQLEELRLRFPNGMPQQRPTSSILQPRPEAVDISIRARTLVEITRILILEEVEVNFNLPGNVDQKTLMDLMPSVSLGDMDLVQPSICLNRELPCDYTSMFRTYDGWCNNLLFPSYGNAFNAQRRLLPPQYDDGFSDARATSVLGGSLPSAREVSNVVHASSSQPHLQYTHAVMQFGQFLDHDIALSPVAEPKHPTTGELIKCHACDSSQLSPDCFPIPIPPNDPFFPQTNSDGTPRCLEFTRSLIGQINLGYRNQMNQITSYIDGSNVYGSTACDVNYLRLYQSGKLNYTTNPLGPLLPQGTGSGIGELQCKSTSNRRPCFVAGDIRSNEHPGLASFHTIFLRQHNLMAEELAKLNIHWSDERLFQEARRINGAIMQHITFNEFLPKVVGNQLMSDHDLLPRRTGYYKGYNQYCDATLANEFAAAAFRFGHTLIREDLPMFDPNLNATGSIEFKNAFFNPDGAYQSLASLVRGMYMEPSESFDPKISASVRNHLFETKDEPYSGLDLAALNVQRGRDHGIAGYNRYREWCGLGRAASFEDLSSTTNQPEILAMQRVYKHVDDVDLFPGLMSERPRVGALVGPTTACIIVEQFRRLKNCDRFYYENDIPETRFTPAQLDEIRKVTMAKILCVNEKPPEQAVPAYIQPDAFQLPNDNDNAPVTCDALPSIDCTKWTDFTKCKLLDPGSTAGTGGEGTYTVIPLGRTTQISPCVACTCTTEGPTCHNLRVASCETLLATYPLDRIEMDTVCYIQCSRQIHEKKREEL